MDKETAEGWIKGHMPGMLTQPALFLFSPDQIACLRYTAQKSLEIAEKEGVRLATEDLELVVTDLGLRLRRKGEDDGVALAVAHHLQRLHMGRALLKELQGSDGTYRPLFARLAESLLHYMTYHKECPLGRVQDEIRSAEITCIRIRQAWNTCLRNLADSLENSDYLLEFIEGTLYYLESSIKLVASDQVTVKGLQTKLRYAKFLLADGDIEECITTLETIHGQVNICMPEGFKHFLKLVE